MTYPLAKKILSNYREIEAPCVKGWGILLVTGVLTNPVKYTILVLKDITALVKLLIPGFPFRSFQ